MSLDNSDINSSSSVLVFPAGRRNVEWYNSRILSDDNFRRSFQAALPAVADNIPSGTLIADYEYDGSETKLSYIALLIGGYYVYLKKSGTYNTLKAINNALGKTGTAGECWVYLEQANVKGTGTNVITDFKELDCEDNESKFYGLFHSSTEPHKELQIPVVIEGGLNPTLDPKQDFYKPWFRSSATFAAGKWSNKNKIWIDDIYDVPHVCITVGTSKKWLPLGAVYKTSNTISEDNLIP